MATITYDSIQVTGVKYKKILSLKIEQCINEHGTAVIKGELDRDTAEEDVARMSVDNLIKITSTAEGQPKCLFCGVIVNTKLNYEDAYATLELTIISTSYLLDIAKNNRSFQNTSLCYGDIFLKMFGNSAQIDMNVTDKSIGKIVMQYNETDWEFIQRVASKFGVVVIVDVISDTPRVTIGLPTKTRKVAIKSITGKVTLENSNNMKIDNSYTVSVGTSYEYGFIGDMFGNEGTIIASETQLVDGILKCIYQYSLEAVSKGYCEKKNTQMAGRMFQGKVEEVKEDKVRVHLMDIDGEFDSDSDYWFPYSTAYSSNDGSGFYCMPAKGDIVRIFFPTENEADAFAASSVNVSPQENPLNKVWKNKDKEILLTPEGIKLSCGDANVFISLDDKAGITMHSDNNINIISPKTIKIASDSNVEIEGKDEILLHTGESFIDILPNGISFGGEQMLIN